jgi:hypothetical protein
MDGIIGQLLAKVKYFGLVPRRRAGERQYDVTSKHCDLWTFSFASVLLAAHLISPALPSIYIEGAARRDVVRTWLFPRPSNRQNHTFGSQLDFRLENGRRQDLTVSLGPGNHLSHPRSEKS